MDINPVKFPRSRSGLTFFLRRFSAMEKQIPTPSSLLVPGEQNSNNQEDNKGLENCVNSRCSREFFCFFVYSSSVTNPSLILVQ